MVLGKQDFDYRIVAVCGRRVLKPVAIVAWAVVFSCPSLLAQGAHSHPVVAPAAVIPLLDGLGEVHYPVVTTSSLMPPIPVPSCCPVPRCWMP